MQLSTKPEVIGHSFERLIQAADTHLLSVLTCVDICMENKLSAEGVFACTEDIISVVYDVIYLFIFKQLFH